MVYIDAEAFKRKLIDEKSFFPAIVARALEEMPAADVVSRSEVATEAFDAVKDAIYAVYNKYVFGNTGYVDKEIEAVIDALTEAMDDIAALKKKYTEESNEKV